MIIWNKQLLPKPFECRRRLLKPTTIVPLAVDPDLANAPLPTAEPIDPILVTDRRAPTTRAIPIATRASLVVEAANVPAKQRMERKAMTLSITRLRRRPRNQVWPACSNHRAAVEIRTTKVTTHLKPPILMDEGTVEEVEIQIPNGSTRLRDGLSKRE